jgi:methionyl-tRNA synthetase
MQTERDRPTFPARRYVTTAIPYVNAAPHLGFALEMVQADTLARFYRSCGDDVRLQTGTDENGLKNVEAADRAGVPVAQLVERNAARFRGLKESLDLSFDDFVRTSTDPRHRQGVERLWQACFAKGDIYKRAYRGLYCRGCEQFLKVSELREGRCPEHGTVVDEIEEENWFFRLSRYRQDLRDLYARGEVEIVPPSRRNEVLSWIDRELEDFSISRSAARGRDWGIAVPGDPDQVIYVWFDALGNYITGLGYGGDAALFSRFWTEATSREHVIGKGIIRFHAVYWPALLLSAGLPVPTRILVHGYVTVEGRKIGKSAGNAIDPVALAAELGTDALRYYLLRHISTIGDADFSRERFRQAYESELAGQLGNLAHRVLTMIERYRGGVVPAPPPGLFEEDRLLAAAARLPETVGEHLRGFAFDRALGAIWAFVALANRYVSEEKPWALADEAALAPSPETASLLNARLDGRLFSLATALDTIAQVTAPLLPGASLRLARKLGERGENDRRATSIRLAGRRIEVGAPLFPVARPTEDGSGISA